MTHTTIKKILQSSITYLSIFLISLIIFNLITPFNLRSNALETNKIKIPKYTYIWENFNLINIDQQLIGAAANKIDIIYFNIEFFINPSINQTKSFLQINSLIKKAKTYNIKLIGLMGNTDWYKINKNKIIYRSLEFIKKYNNTFPISERILGLHLNIEFYNDKLYSKSKNYEIGQYLSFFDDMGWEIREYQKMNPEFRFSTTIPHWTEYNSYIPFTTHNGRYASFFDHSAKIFNNIPNSHIEIMSYRSFAMGEDSIIDITKSEFEKAALSYPKLKLVLGVETINLNDKIVSFYGKQKNYLESQLEIVNSKLINHPNYKAIAIHQLKDYLIMK